MTPYFQDDAVTIIHGDCREVLPTLERAALILTDPPYGVNLAYDTYDDTEANWYALMGAMLPMMRAQAEMVICVSCQIRRLPWVYQNHAPDWLMCWHKGSPGHVSFVGFNDWEPLLVYGKPKGLQMHDYLSIPNTERMGANGHPCAKPEKWAAWLIDRATKPGDTVIDPFMGSGTTLRAAKDLGRKAIGIDLSERYCEIAARRMGQGVLDFGTANAEGQGCRASRHTLDPLVRHSDSGGGA
jgi:site-specific DNA-methyltransferase (adenine-specific)